MITLFTTAKPFVDHFGVIQRNTLMSWCVLQPRVDIILFGDSEGAAQVAAEYGIRHVSEIETTETGTPLIRSMFEQARQISTMPVLCYANCDIIFMEDFIPAIQRIFELMGSQKFLAVGHRTNLSVITDLTAQINWQELLKGMVMSNGITAASTAMDYFCFPRHLTFSMPDFAVGRAGWDGWMIHNALRHQIPIVDLSENVVAVHQNHDYSHLQDVVGDGDTQREFKRNLALIGQHDFDYNLGDATHWYNGHKIQSSAIRQLRGRIKTYRSTFPQLARFLIKSTFWLEHRILKVGAKQ